LDDNNDVAEGELSGCGTKLNDPFNGELGFDE
jgi:hypothetical protein